MARFIITGFLVGALFSTSIIPIYTRIGSYRTNDWTEVVEFVRANSGPADRVLFWGAEAGLNFVTERQSPTKYVYQYPLYQVGYVTPQDISQLTKDLQSNPPLWIIDTKNPITPFLDFPVDNPETMELREWFYQNYTSAGDIQGYTFYRRKGS